ncbi:helix-turn-helix transcriptional regulator [Rhodococcus spelaei]|uniref:Helix-turn-helix transcriptional regulator n=1 Tax=Rhodococcus spelaei TaxID=2546320 RepID=A0A541BNT1_9NOCA|nr:helix-turn-helix domain-containing protein [Rhodococcus spelaei]TQF73991.1 helix-turn-helix transcriptional regulator [Rhodococcus spelaei]
MAQRAEWTDPQCPVARTVDILGDRWSLLIVRDAFDGARKFSEFQRNLGIARNILADRLRTLVEHGILTPKPSGSGTRHEYALTDSGRDLFTVVVSLRQWGERHAFRHEERRSTMIDESTGHPAPTLRFVNADGIVLDSTNTHVRKVDDH